MRNRIWLCKILLLASILCGGFLLINSEVEAEPGLRDVTTNALLPYDINFEFNFSGSEEVYNLHSNQIELGELNKLTLSFRVNGMSGSPGLKIVFIFMTIKVGFVVDRIFNDDTLHNLTETFLFPHNYSGSMDITVICSGSSTSTRNGFLTIFNSTKIEQMNIPTISEDSFSLPTSQDWVMFKGNIYSWNRGGITSAFYNYDEMALVSLNISFSSNYFQSIENVVEISLNGNFVAEDYFIEDLSNNIDIQFQPEIGLNLLSLNFSVSYSFNPIYISNISLFGSLFNYESSSSTSDSFSWESGFFSYSFDLSTLKPPGYYSEQVLHLTINYQCFGMKISSGINYFLKIGTSILEEGTISYLEQMYENNSLKIETFTTEYHNPLTFKIFGTSNGVGGLTILNSSTIEISHIGELTKQPLSRTIADERSVNGPSLAVSLSFYDVFQTYRIAAPVQLAVNFNTVSTYEHPFDLLTVTVKIDGVRVISKNVHILGFANFSKEFSLEHGYHEVRINFQFSGINTPLTVEQLKYQLALQIEEEITVSTALSYARQSTFYLLAFYALLYVLLDVKEINRERIKEKESSIREDSIEDANDDSRNLLRTALMVVVNISINLTPSVFFLLHGINYWFILPLSFFVALHFSIKILFSNFSKDAIVGFWNKTRDFFRDIYSLSGFLNKVTRSFGKLSFRSLTRLLVFAIAFLSFGLLFFLADNIPSNAVKEVWIVYALLLVCIVISSLTLFYTLHLVRDMAFIEDNLKRIKRLGYASITLVAGFLFVLISMLGTKLSLSSIWGFLSPILLFGIFRTTTKLGKISAKEEKLSFDDFLDKGMFFTDKKEMRKAVSFGINTRSTWEKKGYELQKHQIKGVIAYDYNPGDKINLYELAEKIKLPFKKTEELVQEIEKEVPRLGKYDPQSKIYTKSKENIIEAQEIQEKIVPDKYENEEKNVEMSKIPTKNISTKERFQKLLEEVVGESDEEKRRTLEYVNHLTAKEAEVYQKFLKKGLGDQDIVITNSDREFLQRAWKKIHVQEDIFQRNSSSNLLREYYDKISDAHNGFDDVVFEIKKELFKISFLEYKVGDRATYYPWEYIPKFGYHLLRRELNEKQLLKYIEKNPIVESLFSSQSNLGKKKVPLIIRKLYYDRNRQYHIIGNDWLVKFMNGDFQNALSHLVTKGLLTNKQKKRITVGLSEFNQLVGLAQNGHTFRVFDNTKKIQLESCAEITLGGKQIILYHDFFLPKFEINQEKISISLQGFNKITTSKHNQLNLLIKKEYFLRDDQEDKILVLYAKLKREFLLDLIKSKLMDHLQVLYDKRYISGLDTITSSDFIPSIDKLKKQPTRQRGIVWFYDDIQVSPIDFLTNKKFKEILQEKDEELLFSKLASLLSDTETFFEDEGRKQFSIAYEAYKNGHFDFFLFNQSVNEIYKPPTYSFRQGNIPKTGVILVDHNNRIINLISPSKAVSILLEEGDILLNFPFRWDSHYGYFAFTQKGNRMSNVAKSWYDWLIKANLPIPSGSSGRIPDISVIAMLLEWWTRQENFVINRILSNQVFIESCRKHKIVVDKDSTMVIDSKKNSYKLARVSVTQTGNIRHKENWKYYAFYNDKIRTVIDVLKAAIFDLVLQKGNISSAQIPDLRNWLKINWLEEFEKLKEYFF